MSPPSGFRQNLDSQRRNPIKQYAIHPAMTLTGELPSIEDVHASTEILYSMGEVTVAGLGPNIVVKYGQRARMSEVDTMKFVVAKTNIPMPKILEAFERDGKTYIYMTQVPGKCLDDCMSDLSEAQLEQVVQELAGFVNEMRNLGENNYIGSINRGPCTDYLWQYNTHLPGGPFENEAQLNDFIASAYLARWGGKFHMFLRSIYRDDHRILFTHSDISPRNIMVSEEGHITGIIDWEYAGWYPEYWEAAKAFFGADW